MDDLDALRSAIARDPALSSLLSRVQARLVDDPGHDLGHCLRVALWTIRLGGEAVDRRCAVAAALLHDLVNPPKSSPERRHASELSAAAAREILPELGFDVSSVDSVALAIRDHSFSRGVVPESLLGKALQDADRLEALGAIGILRTVSAGVRMGARYFDPEDPWARNRALDDRTYTIDHFFTKLLGLAATMNTEQGRLEADRRARFLRSFLSQLGNELGSTWARPPAE